MNARQGGRSIDRRGGRIARWRRPSISEPAVAAASLVALAVAVIPLATDIHRDVDEGFNLMKAALFARGYSLYAEIWSDQPPVLTFILSAVHGLSDRSLAAPRLVSLGFAAWLAASLFRIVLRAEGRVAAWTAVIALVGATAVARSSVTVLVGLPAIAFAAAALDHLLIAAERAERWRFALAGLLFGLALQTKLFALILLPALAVAAFVAMARPARGSGSPAVGLAIAFAAAAAVFLLIAALTGEAILTQLIQPHLVVARLDPSAPSAGVDYLLSIRPKMLFVGGALGLLAFAAAPSLIRSLPLVWLATAIIALLLHRPLWWHHAAMVEVPLAWLTGMATVPMWRLPWNRVLVFGFAGLVAFYSGETWSRLKRTVDRRAATQDTLLLTGTDQDSSRWIVSDLAIDAYVLGRMLPPEFAVLSLKRHRAGGGLTVAGLSERAPSEVLLTRFRPPTDLLQYLENRYRRVPPFTRGVSPAFHFVERQPAPTATGGSAPQTVDTLTNVSREFAGRAVGGGFAARYDLTTGNRFARAANLLAGDRIVARSPGSTQSVGQCFLDAYRLTRRPVFRDLAMDTGRALVCAQNVRGGWSEEPRLRSSCIAFTDANDTPRGGPLTLDEGATPSAIDFLMDLEAELRLRVDVPPRWLAPAIKKGLRALLAAQDPGGGWPQRSPPPRHAPYAAHFTFNDGAMTSAIATLLRAHARYHDPAYLQSAVLAGDFILRTQGSPPQAGWAQQYDQALRPAAARSFEPAGYSSHESGLVMNALLDLYLATGAERFVAALAPARRWLERSEIRPGVWARLYEPATNRPIYGDRDGSTHYRLDEISQERREEYHWEMRFPSVVRAFARHDAFRAGGIEALREFDSQPAPLSLEERARLADILGTAEDSGRWSVNGAVETQTFVDNCRLILRALAEQP